MIKITVQNDFGGIKDLLLISPLVFLDNQGGLMESFNMRDLAASGLNVYLFRIIRAYHIKMRYEGYISEEKSTRETNPMH